jgi:transcriptional regulator with XRE-family HTH domain
MNKEKRAALEAAGYVFGDYGDFLELTEHERHLVEFRVAVSRAVRMLREKQGMTQKQLARLLKTSQPHVARLEAGTAGVSLDSMFKAYFVLGGKSQDFLASLSLIRPLERLTHRAARSARPRRIGGKAARPDAADR